MYRVLLIFNSYELLEEVKKLRIWKENSDFIIEDIANDGTSAYRKLKEKKYDLVITEIRIVGIDGLQLLRRIKKEGLCPRVVLCSEFLDFNYARQGIILGVYDYFVRPFDERLFFSLFNRIKSETFEEKAVEIYQIEEIMTYFENRDKDIYNYIDSLFDKNEWLDLYISKESLYGFDGINESNQNSYIDYYKNTITSLFDNFCELKLKCGNVIIREVIMYILNNPENNLKQKNIASEFFINSSYLSTVFLAQTGIRFVDYLTTVKLKRVVYLLKETNMKITDIAERLDYKDIGYFSRIFKNKYKLPPSAYRLSDGYDFQI